ncbi:pentapeptide repeat-containing protein, partial [Rickettsiaceae bacterium]|nr:pentapeptide repeat-containing protein [Rickettsiaceae bacterium]
MKSIDEIKYKLKKDLDISIKKHEATIEDINGYRESVRSGNVINFNEYIKNHYYKEQNVQIISSISKGPKITGDFFRLDFSGLDFSGTIFQEVNFSECNLQNTKFHNSDFQNVIIEKSQLNNTDFSGSNL